MIHLSRFIPALVLCTMACTNAEEQTPQESTHKTIVGGGCDGCEIMYAGMPKEINPIDTSAGWFEEGDRLLINGVVVKKNGAPAPGVIIYYWQTDHTGHYSPAPGLEADAMRHGHIRGWVKSNGQGQFTIYTNRPAPYPDHSMPAHIHTAIKEPDLNEYYIDEFVFDDDPLLTEAKRKALENRGGSGILKPVLQGGVQVATHRVVLGENIPDYPAGER